jgi:hypothetical protein
VTRLGTNNTSPEARGCSPRPDQITYPRDSFENRLTDLFDTSIGKPAVANVSVSFESVAGQAVCRVEVEPSHQPVYARGKQGMDFYVRLNNGTRSLDLEEAVAYISAHDWARG